MERVLEKRRKKKKKSILIISFFVCFCFLTHDHGLLLFSELTTTCPFTITFQLVPTRDDVIVLLKVFDLQCVYLVT
ncbi:Protein CBG25276 [Caenorhabditis briggsae]|uniref:Protein CBG25276 n=1 Tax=Caenorhabditis briggsae TaxID=6238 RepID=B6IIJ4_CAEBR|nr:Protein CBG25276 [Caenorhabditis briggsae]CAR99724.1 Protein CBG25276 [Caenorhabditis briggsae]